MKVGFGDGAEVPALIAFDGVGAACSSGCGSERTDGVEFVAGRVRTV